MSTSRPLSSGRVSRCRPIVVLGAERSGTSMVAEMVRHWGAYAGEPENLRKGDEHNPRGYWEYTPVWDFLVELGDFAEGASWWDMSFQDRVKAKAEIPLGGIRNARRLAPGRAER